MGNPPRPIPQPHPGEKFVAGGVVTIWVLPLVWHCVVVGVVLMHLGVALADVIDIRWVLIIGGAIRLFGASMFHLWKITAKEEA